MSRRYRLINCNICISIINHRNTVNLLTLSPPSPQINPLGMWRQQAELKAQKQQQQQQQQQHNCMRWSSS
jgi:hypothetical protein